jgi:catechol 2,3-dioxygenase-like lactoylglutathione lyase family enzyme
VSSKGGQEPPLCAPLIPVSVKAWVFQIGQSVSVLDVVSTISAQEAARLQHDGGPIMIDHVYISVTQVEKSLAFYAEALKPLGWSLFGNYDAAAGPETVPDLYGLADNAYVSGTGPGSSIWLRQRKPGETGLYLGLVCDSNEAVDAAYAAALKAGGTDEGEPADRTYFAPGYYAANVADFDGNRLEFVHKAWNPPAS